MMITEYANHVARSEKQSFKPLTPAQFAELVGRIHTMMPQGHYTS